MSSYVLISLPIEEHYVGSKSDVIWDMLNGGNFEGFCVLRDGKTRNLFTLKMEMICSSETSVLLT
jgi:hypothetical protein